MMKTNDSVVSYLNLLLSCKPVKWLHEPPLMNNNHFQEGYLACIYEPNSDGTVYALCIGFSFTFLYSDIDYSKSKKLIDIATRAFLDNKEEFLYDINDVASYMTPIREEELVKLIPKIPCTCGFLDFTENGDFPSPKRKYCPIHDNYIIKDY